MITIEHIDQKITESTNELNTFAKRVLFALKNAKRPQAWLAERLGISKQALSYILTQRSHPKFATEIATELGINLEWLITGKGTFIHLSEPINKQIPLIKLEDVGSDNPINLSMIPVFRHYPTSCFATKLENDSMEPRFAPGCILIFDPEKKPSSGDFVLFSPLNSNHVFFRQYFLDGCDIYLKTIASGYENFKCQNLKFYGVLLESRNEFT